MIIFYIHLNPVRMTEHLTEIWVGTWVGAWPSRSSTVTSSTGFCGGSPTPACHLLESQISHNGWWGIVWWFGAGWFGLLWKGFSVGCISTTVRDILRVEKMRLQIVFWIWFQLRRMRTHQRFNKTRHSSEMFGMTQDTTGALSQEWCRTQQDHNMVCRQL